MNFEEFFLSFVEQTQGEDIENIIPLLLINGLIDPDDMLNLPDKWLQVNCDVIAHGDHFEILQEKKGKRRIFVDDYDDPTAPFPICAECSLVAKEEVVIDEYDDFDKDPDKYKADYCAEIINSSHMNMDGKSVLTCAWFSLK